MTNFLGMFSNRIVSTFRQSTLTIGGRLVHAVSSNGSTSFPMVNQTGTTCLNTNRSLSRVHRTVPRGRGVVNVSNLLASSRVMASVCRTVSRFSIHGRCSGRVNRTLTISTSNTVLTRVTGLTIRRGRGVANLNGNIVLSGRVSTASVNVARTRNGVVIRVLLRLGTGFSGRCIPTARHCICVGPSNITTLMTS